MSKDYNFEVGYETLRKDWEVYKKQTPRGVTLVKGSNNIYLQFKTPNTPRSKHKCNCTFSIDGMNDAVRKANKVKEKLDSLKSETEFWDWYKKEVEQESQLIDDRLTFEEAIKKVENDFWERLSRTKRKRDKSNHSDQTSWNDTYYRFYKKLPLGKPFELNSIETALSSWEKGSKTYEGAVSAMKHLSRTIRRTDIYDCLCEINAVQTKFKELQNADLESFLVWRDEILGVTKELSKLSNTDAREAWMWVFSMQVTYGLRISEVFAIKNLFEAYITKDGVSIPALNDASNIKNLIYIGDKTAIDTTVKTGNRIARPMIPPKYPDLIDKLNLKSPVIPTNKPKSNNSKSISNFYNKTAYKCLTRWNGTTTETHAFRHLANINGMQAGISKEVRSQSLGHTEAMNDGTYKKRQSTQTTIDLLLDSNVQAIDFVTALASVKRLCTSSPEDKEISAKILSIIYQKDKDEIITLL